MIGYVTLGTNDIKKSAAFYDEVLAILDAKRVWDEDRFINWGNGKGSPLFSVIKPYDGEAATSGNGTMVALAAGSEEKVNAMYQKALELGASDEGEPGKRTDNFYGAYFRDFDGNKICVFCMVK